MSGITSIGAAAGLSFLIASCCIDDTKSDAQREEIKKALEAAQKEDRERKASSD